MSETSERPRAQATVSGAAVAASTDTSVHAGEPFTLVIFGASGDLAKRKLVPALWQLEKAGFLQAKYAVVGFSRTAMSDDAYRDSMVTALKELGGGVAATKDDRLVRSLYYQAGNNDDLKSFQNLKARLEQIEKEQGLPGNRLFYLSVSPEFFPVIIQQLGAAGLIHDAAKESAWSRVIIEKPFGRDLTSARALSKLVTGVLDESQIYRIDHYLGKETVQNILSFRFGNSIFEPLFSQKYVDNVQITVSETLGMEGKRGAYYDTAGTLRDMVQNHMLQTLTLVAMEPPAQLDSQSIRDEKVKVVRALVPMSPAEVARNTVRAQYAAGRDEKGGVVKAYREEEGVKPNSTTESYVALKLSLDNWRWAGVPFFLRSGKRLGKRVSEIAIQFKQPPVRLFRPISHRVEELGARIDPHANVLLLRIQPDEGIRLSVACKIPGMKIQLADVDMDFTYRQGFQQRSPEAYERLLLDALRGDASLFTRSDEVEYAWRFITAIHEGWAMENPARMAAYAPFSDGPAEAARLLEGTRATWRPLSMM
ncbi:MAG TPA: glucose-6-phosphate dehydrogenase [bacterium]|nr:glucose-6-phosphate dehydrogenase [bacterium]